MTEFGYNPEIFVAFEDEFRRMNQLGQSPSAGLRFWIGKTFMAQAQKEKDKTKKIKLYIKAVQKFLYVLKKMKGYPKEAMAYSDLVICIKELKKLGKNVTIKDLKDLKPKGADNVKKMANVMPADAKKYMESKQYVKAIPILLDVAQKNRINPGVADVLGNLAFAYVNTNQNLEGLAIADYVGKSFPNEKTVPLAILRAAETLWRGKKKEDALYFYEIYLDAAPTDQYASAISTRVAKEHYDRAAAIAKQANKLQGDAKEKKVAQAVKAFKNSIPHYERIIKNYGNDKKNVDNAYYLMGLSYASAKEFDKAAETFIKASEMQKSPTKLASVKLNAADNFFKGGQNAEKEAKKLREEAYALDASELKTKKLADADKLDKDAKKFFKNSVSNLNELLDKWMVSGGKIGAPKSSKLKKAYQSSLQLLAWAYDASGDKKKSIATFQRFIAKYPKSPKVPACMSRMGILYYELNDYTTSAKVLENLANKFPTSPEAKSAYYNLGRNMYEIGNYTKAFEVFNKIFNQKVEISIANLRWIASNLVNCGNEHPKAGAVLSLTASKMLLQRLKSADKDMASWVGEKMAGQLKTKPKEKAKTLDIIKQKILFDAGSAAFYSGDTTKAIAYLDELLDNKNTPYFYKAKFARAEAYEKMKNYDKARQDLGEIALAAMTAKKDATSTQAKTLVGKTYIAQKMYKKAYASYNLIAKSLNTAGLKVELPNMTDEQRKALAKEREEEKYWIEEAVYQGAFCAAKLGMTADVKRLQALYKKHFPKGRYIKKIDKMPAAEKANKQ
jgi:TolA-binding protein